LKFWQQKVGVIERDRQNPVVGFFKVRWKTGKTMKILI